ncbi:MAG: methyltransferase domain-containing protein [Actinomycetota bacterium]|nr:methyltransferase domain-containing protein [Actinomycetota bacterium]
MWRIESQLGDAGAHYDRRAAAYDRLIRSTLYNRIAWSTSPADYADFAAQAFASGSGPLLEVAAGSAAATALLHARSRRPTVLVDASRAMLERAGQNIAALSPGREAGGPRVRLVQAHLLTMALPTQFTTVLGLGFMHLFEDLDAALAALRAVLAPGGELYLAGLVADTRRGQRYLQLLHRAGEVAVPRTGDQLREALNRPTDFETKGCMAYARITAT